MRVIFLGGLALLASGCATSGGHQDFRHGPPPGQGGGHHGNRGGGDGGPRARLFISPMGEPFRSEHDGADPQDLWFQGADANHDGKITAAEFQQDAARWFAVLDRGHDGEIDPDDIDYYETVLAPEVRSGGDAGGGRGGGGGSRGSGGGGGRGGGMHGGGGGHGGGGHRGGGGGSSGSSDSGGQTSQPAVDYSKRGAARYSWFDLPEPITPMDTDFNRGVSTTEFATAADQRFAALDKNHDGVLEQSELPRVSGFSFGGRPGRRPGGPQPLPKPDE